MLPRGLAHAVPALPVGQAVVLLLRQLRLLLLLLLLGTLRLGRPLHGLPARAAQGGEVRLPEGRLQAQHRLGRRTERAVGTALG